MKRWSTKDYEKKKVLAEEARKSKLYMNIGLMRDFYKRPENIEQIVVVYDDEEPVGCGIVYDKGKYGSWLSVYVKLKYRKKGIGTKIVKHLFRFRNKDKPLHYSIERKEFFQKVLG